LKDPREDFSVEALLERVTRAGIHLWLEAEQLRFRAPPNALSTELRREVQEHRVAIISHLRRVRPIRLGAELAKRARPRHLPLSFAQEQLWLVEQLGTLGSTYNVPLVLELSGILSSTALQIAFETVLSRHESLRTRFVAFEGGAQQIIEPASQCGLESRELAGASAAQLQQLIRHQAEQPFDLRNGPLLRILLVRASAERHLLIMTLHHIVCDGWSMANLLQELSESYAASLEQRAAQLPALPLQYADYALWQREWMSGEVLEQHLQYWQGQLQRAPALLRLPTDRPRPALASFRGAALSVSLPQAALQQLQALGRSQQATLFMLLLCAFKVVLFRWSGQQDLVVGSVVAGRARAELEPLIGFFINTLPLRTHIDPSQSFLQLLHRVRAQVLEAYSHQDVPFEKVVAHVQPARSLSHQPVVQVALLLQQLPTQHLRLPGVHVREVPVPPSTAKLDLALHLLEQPDGSVQGSLEYATDLFDAASMQVLANSYVQALELFSRRPQALLTELPAVVTRGKLVWDASPEMDRASTEPANELDAAAVATAEATIGTLWAELLKLERVGARENFFELGGYSLLAAKLAARLSEQQQVELSVQQIFENPTVAQLARLVTALHSASPSALPSQLAPRPAELPLSFAQEQLWLVQQLGTLGSTYHVPLVFELSGDLSSAALRAAFEGVVSRHESLRTRFVAFEGGARQVIEPAGRCLLESRELSEASPAQLQRLICTQTEQTFDLSAGPLLRILLVNVSAQPQVGTPRHLLILTLHHIVFDGWSVANLLQELTELYTAALAQRAAALPALPLQYADYALWQRDWMSGESLEQHLHYWQQQLVGAPALLRLPTDRPRPALPSFKGAALAVPLPQAAIRELRALGRTQQATLFMLLLCAFKIVLFRWSGEQDLVVGTAVAGRTRAELEPLIGFFVNTLALRSRIDPQHSFVQLLQHLRAQVLQAYSHQDVPFEKVVARVQPTRSLSHQPVFQVALLLQQHPAQYLHLPGLQVSEVPVPPTTAKLDLALHVLEQPDGSVQASLEYATDLFDAASMQVLANSYVQALELFSRRPQALLTELPAVVTHGKLAWDASPAIDPELAGPASELDAVAVAAAEASIGALWAELLKLERVGPQDNFFDLGGYSLLAAKLAARLSEQQQVELSVQQIFENPTVRQLAWVVVALGSLQTHSERPRSTCTLHLAGDADAPKLFLLHPLSGQALCYRELALQLRTELGSYALQRPEVVANEPVLLRDVPALAQCYLHELLTVQPQGPYRLAGWSFGGIVALQLAALLREMQHDVVYLGLIDTVLPQDDDIGRHLRSSGGGNGTEVLRWLAQIPDSARQHLDGAWAHLGNLEPLPPRAGAAAEHERQLYLANLWACYAPLREVGVGRLHCYFSEQTSADPVAASTRAALRCLSTELRCVTLPGDHYSLLRPPNVAMFAERMRTDARHGEP
jgi:non-ribosomal peptide synthetase component F/thioesterase domain-containing protein